MTGLTIDLEILAGREFGDLFTHTGGESMYQNSGLRVPPEMFNATKNKVLGIIAWANTESGHVTSREFNELLSGYLTTEHFAFIESEARLHHTLQARKGALSNRQNEITHLILMGLTNKAIAETLLVSEATVHHEVTKILKIFGVINRGGLIDYFKNLNSIEKEETA
jgi:DNA-binding CsgD family transcriptional regulator